MIAQVLVPCHPIQAPGLSLTYYGQLGSEPVDTRSFIFSLPILVTLRKDSNLDSVTVFNRADLQY